MRLEPGLGRGFGLQAEVFSFRAFGSPHGGPEATATRVQLSSGVATIYREQHSRNPA